MKHLFILNPVSGGRHHDHTKTRDTIESAMTSLGLEYEIYTTTGKMDACRRVKEAGETGDEIRVYACGGDGTLNECVNGAVGYKNLAVTHYPCGTGNDFIRMFGDEAARFRDISELVYGEVRPVDLINCNGRYSDCICSVGFDAKVAADVHKYNKYVHGKAAYVLSLVVNLFRGINTKMRITTECGEESGRYALLCACNGRYYGGGFNPVKDARPDDGVMDTLIVKHVSVFELSMLIGKYAKGEYYKLPNYVTRVGGRQLTIETEKETVVNIDGEIIRAKKISINLAPGAVNMLFPSNMEFFNNELKKNEATA